MVIGFVAVHLPGFRLERCGWSGTGEVALVRVERGAERVVTCSPAAVAAGISAGMTLAAARAVSPLVKVERLELDGEARDLEALAVALHRFTPQVQAVPPEDLLLEVGPGQLAAVRACLEAFGHRLRLVWAPRPQLARLLARHLPEDRAISAVELPAVLAPLPVAGLDLPPPVLEALNDVGIRTIGQFARLPAAALVGRFGAAIADLHALAAGREPSPALALPPVRPESAFAVVFEDAVDTLDALLFVLHGLLRDLASSLEATGQAAVRVQVRFRLEEGEFRLPIRLGQPSRGTDRLFRVLKARLERVQLGAPVVEVHVELLEAVAFAPSQPGLLDRAQAPEPLDELVARLQDTLGVEAVVVPHLAQEHRPEDGWRARPVGVSGPPAPPPVKQDPAAVHEPVGEARPRPALLLPAPEALRVAAAPSGRPRALHLGHDWVPLAGVAGPERIVGSWWNERAYARDYWRVDLPDGRRAWVYRECLVDGGEVTAGRWMLHGWFDGPSADPPPPAAEAPAPGVLQFPVGGRAPVRSTPAPPRARSRKPAPRYAELVCRSNYSFCEGASHPPELVERAHALGLDALALTDRDGLYGNVQAHRAAAAIGLPLIHGSLLTVRLEDRSVRTAGGPAASVVALVQDRKGWASLCRLLTAARMEGGDLASFRHQSPPQPPGRAPVALFDPPPAGQIRAEKGWAELPLETLVAGSEGLILLARGDWPEGALRRVRDQVGDRLYRAVSRRLTPGDDARIAALAAGPVPCVATNDVLLHDPGRQRLQDVLTCIRLGTTLERAGRRLQPNAERVLLSPERMYGRFAASPDMLSRTLEVRERCYFSLAELTYRYPREVVPDGYTGIQWLREMVRRGARERYGVRIPPKVRDQLEHELGIIERLDFATYFLTVSDVVRFARERGILCQGRGSAANSAVCYVLGVTSVDPSQTNLLFERFISEERGEPPDIDIDFEHERREEVFVYVYEKYGRERAAMVNEVIAWRGRMAVRDVGKALGYGPDQVEQLSKTLDMWGRGKLTPERLREAGLDPEDRNLVFLGEMVEGIQGFPRHTSIHVGGFVISDGPLVDCAPIEPARRDGRTVLQWDKNDVDDLKFVKVDLLSLGMLTAIRKCFGFLRSHHGLHLDLTNVPREDPGVYDMLCQADSTGVFQVESRAQQSMLPRLKPRSFYDLVVETAIVRPGPIQGGMVHPYLRRRSGEEPITYADERLRPILARTMGVPIFQEQVMAMAVAVGGFTPGEADALRRAMGAWRKRGGLEQISGRLLAGMQANGISPEFAEQIQKQIQGFAEYGFPESHAASFAHLVYVSAWMRCHYPAAFCAALINSQPMGFYAPRSLLADAQRHGVEVREIDIRWSDWDCTLEEGLDGPAIRVGLRLVKGLREEDGRAFVRDRARGPYTSIPDFARRTGASRAVLQKLARADVLRGLPVAPPSPVDAHDSTRARPPSAGRRDAAWAVEGLWPGMFAGLGRRDEAVTLPRPTPGEDVQADYAATGLSLRAHPVGLVRKALDRAGVTPLSRLIEQPTGQVVRIAGMVSHRQRPDTASGVVFMTLEDETATVNVVVWPKVFERQHKVIRGERLVRIAGKVERDGDTLNVIAWRFWPLTIAPDVLASSRDFR